MEHIVYKFTFIEIFKQFACFNPGQSVLLLLWLNYSFLVDP